MTKFVNTSRTTRKLSTPARNVASRSVEKRVTPQIQPTSLAECNFANVAVDELPSPPSILCLNDIFQELIKDEPSFCVASTAAVGIDL